MYSVGGWKSFGHLYHMRLSKISMTLWLLGAAFMLLGVVFKLLHLSGAAKLLLLGVLVTICGLLSAVRDVWTKP